MARRSAVPAVVGLALLAACGTTVPAGQVSAASGGELGLPGSSLQAGTGAATTEGAAPGSGAGSTAGAAGPAASGSSSSAPGRQVSPTGPTSLPGGLPGGETGRGFTRTTVQIGIADSDVNSYANTLGVKGVATGDETAQVDAVVSSINRSGGLLGRRIELVWYHASSAQTINNPSVVDEEACATWTQDHHVYAVVGPIGIPVDRDLLACLAKTHTPVIGAGNPWGIDTQPYFQEFYNAFPDFVNIDSMLGETLLRITVARLVGRSFFEPWDTARGAPASGAVKPPVKVGVVIHDNPTGQRMLAVLTQELARFGITITDVARLSGGVTQTSADAQNAALRFHSDGITHELGTAAMAFAEGQNYRPRYFIPDEPQLIAANVPKGQLQGAMSESYIPALDVGVDPGPPTPATTRCLKLMQDAHQDTANGTARYLMEAVCDGFSFLRAAVTASGSLTRLTPGLESLGSHVGAAMTWQTRLGPGQHASAGALRDVGYDNGCSCFRYTSDRNWS